MRSSPTRALARDTPKNKTQILKEFISITLLRLHTVCIKTF
ncbi:MAG: hypothetical protein RML94_02905 [Bacteroidia bacterium]|nr:hypothetical protein [Bacteroidia bacterium]